MSNDTEKIERRIDYETYTSKDEYIIRWTRGFGVITAVCLFVGGLTWAVQYFSIEIVLLFLVVFGLVVTVPFLIGGLIE